MEKIKNYLYEKTGMFVDWSQLKDLPEIDTFIDIGVGENGTPEFYSRFPNSYLILIDPLEEAYKYAHSNLNHRNFKFYKTALGEKEDSKTIKVEESLGRSTLLDITEINYEYDIIDKREIKVQPLDNVIDSKKELKKIGIKIDTEGYELNVIKGAKDILLQTQFVVAEVRHNVKSYTNQYELYEFMHLMSENGFVLSKIITAKPLIADLCFERVSNLINK